MNSVEGMNRFWAPWIFLSLLLCATVSQSAWSQSTTLGKGTALGCAPSDNGTGHLDCLIYDIESVTGVSWLAPANANPANPAPMSLSIETADTFGAPGCGPADDQKGVAVCVVMTSKGVAIGADAPRTAETLTLSGVAFYPPSATKSAVVALGSVTTIVGTQTASFSSNPSCVSTQDNAQGTCAVIINGKVESVSFDPRTSTSSGLVLQPFGTGFSNEISCTDELVQLNAENAGWALCTVRNGTTLEGIAFNIAKGTADSISITLGTVAPPANSSVVASSCTAPRDTTNVAICGVISGTELMGYAFDPRTNTMVGPKVLGPAPDTGIWAPEVGCAFSNDVNFLGNVTCAAVSSSGKVYAVEFDPRVAGTPTIRGPFLSGATSSPSCVTLNIDTNQITCATTNSGGSAVGFDVPIPTGG
jgi:hypothetical protein